MTRFEALWQGYNSDELNADELGEFLSLLSDHADDLGDRVVEDLRTNKFTGRTTAAQRAAMLSVVLERTRSMPSLAPVGRYRGPFIRRMMAAAAVLILLGGAGFWAIWRGRQAEKNPSGQV